MNSEEQADVLLRAVETATNPISSQTDRLNAHQVLKAFEENLASSLPLIFQLIDPSCALIVRQYGLHLLEQFIRIHWITNDQNDAARQEIRSKILEYIRLKLIASGEEFPLIRECYAKCLNEIAKKEFPQKWSSFFEDCAILASSGINQRLIVISFWTRLFEDVVHLQNVEPARRRRDLFNVLVDKIDIFFDSSVQILRELSSQNDDKLQLKMKVVNLEFLSNVIDLIPVKILSVKCKDLFAFLYEQLQQVDCVLVQASLRCLSQFKVPKHGKLDYQLVVLEMSTSENMLRLQKAFERLISSGISQQTYDCLKIFGDFLLSFCSNWCLVWDDRLQNDEVFMKSVDVSLNIIYSLLQHPSIMLRSKASAVCCIITKNEQFCKCCLLADFAKRVIEVIPSIIQSIGFPSKRESPFSDYSQFEFDSDMEFIVEFSKYRESVMTFFKRLLKLDFRPAYSLMTKFLCQKLPNQPDTISAVEWDAWNKFTSHTLLAMNENPACDSEAYHQDYRLMLTSVLNTLKQRATILNADLLLSTLSALLPLLRCNTDLVPDVCVQIFRLTLWPDPETSEASRKLRHHSMHEFVHLTVEQTSVLVPYISEIMHAMESRASELTLRQKSSLVEGFAVLSNEFKNFGQQKQLIDYLVKASIDYLSCEEFVRASSDCVSFATYVGLCNFTSEILDANDMFFSRRKEILSHIILLTGVLNRCAVPTEAEIIQQGGYCNADDDTNVRHPCFDTFRPVIHQLFCLARCTNGLYTKKCVDSIHPVYGGYKVLGLMEFEKNFNMLSAMVLQQQQQQEKDEALKTFDHLQLFVADLMEKMQIIIGLIVSKFDWQFYELPEASDYLRFGILDYVEDSLDQRLRFWIRRCFGPIVLNVKDKYRQKLLPCLSVIANHVHKRLCDRWQALKQRILTDEKEKQADDLTQQEIFLDDLTRLFTREYFTFLRLVLISDNSAASKKFGRNTNAKSKEQSSEADDDENNVEETLENIEMKEQGGKPDVFSSSVKISPLGVDVLDPKNKCAESITRTVFNCFIWLDTLSILKACEIGTIIVKQLMATNLLDENVVEYIFNSVLFSLQMHGQHDITCGNILSFLCFLHEFLGPNFACVKRLLSELPESSLNRVEAYERKLKNGDDGNGKTLTTKVRRDLFRRIVSGIIGENIGQRFKNKVSYKLGLPIYLKTKREETANSPESINNSLCLLFGDA